MNKYSDRSMEVKLWENYDKPTDRPTDRPGLYVRFTSNNKCAYNNNSPESPHSIHNGLYRYGSELYQNN